MFSKTSWHSYASVVLGGIFNSLFFGFFFVFIKATFLPPLSLSFQRSSKIFLLCIHLSTANIKTHLKLTEGSLSGVVR